MPKSKPVFVIEEEDVWRIAERMNVEIPEEAKMDVIYHVKKAIDSYCFDSSFNIWNAVEEAIKEALQGFTE